MLPTQSGYQNHEDRPCTNLNEVNVLSQWFLKRTPLGISDIRAKVKGLWKGLDVFRLVIFPGVLFWVSAWGFHFEEGNPGCFEFIRGRVLSESEIRRLPDACQKLRLDYLELIQPKQNSKQVRAALVKALTHSKTKSTPYEAILFAMLMKDPSLLTALKTRARHDRNLALPFRYAELALLRIAGTEPDYSKAPFNHPFYSEIRVARDVVLEHRYGGQR